MTSKTVTSSSSAPFWAFSQTRTRSGLDGMSVADVAARVPDGDVCRGLPRRDRPARKTGRGRLLEHASCLKAFDRSASDDDENPDRAEVGGSCCSGHPGPRAEQGCQAGSISVTCNSGTGARIWWPCRRI